MFPRCLHVVLGESRKLRNTNCSHRSPGVDSGSSNGVTDSVGWAIIPLVRKTGLGAVRRSIRIEIPPTWSFKPRAGIAAVSSSRLHAVTIAAKDASASTRAEGTASDTALSKHWSLALPQNMIQSCHAGFVLKFFDAPPRGPSKAVFSMLPVRVMRYLHCARAIVKLRSAKNKFGRSRCHSM